MIISIWQLLGLLAVSGLVGAVASIAFCIWISRSAGPFR